MKNLFRIALLSIVISNTAQSQVRITAAAGFNYEQSPTLTGQLNVGYDFKKVGIQADIISLPIRKATWFGANAGALLKVNDDLKLRPCAGIYFKNVGSRNSQDRYIKDGNTTVLSDNLETNSWQGEIGIQIIRQHLFIGMYGLAGKDQINFGVTVGITHLFDRSN